MLHSIIETGDENGTDHLPHPLDACSTSDWVSDPVRDGSFVPRRRPLHDCEVTMNPLTIRIYATELARAIVIAICIFATVMIVYLFGAP